MSATKKEVIADLKYCKESLDRIVKYTERNYKDSPFDNYHTVIQADIIKLRRDLNEVITNLIGIMMESEDKA